MRLCWLLLTIGPLLAQDPTEEESLSLRRIADFWEEREYQIVKNEMEEFISQYPESSYMEALCAALGDLYLREKNYSNALNYYSRIQTPEFYQRVFLNRMQCLYEMQWYATLADECEKYLENQPNLHVTYFLAISLYHQCLNASKDPEQLTQFAERARPHFETLAQSDLSEEVAQGFAHLCCILKDYPKASEIYLHLAEEDPSLQEEMLFQAALIQTQYDKALAAQTFDRIAQLGQTKAKEAIYNKLLLSFEAGHFEQIATEELLQAIPPEKVEAARLLLGRSLLNLKKYPDATAAFKEYLQNTSPSDAREGALLGLLEAAYQASDVSSLDAAIEELTRLYPDHTELPKAYFSRAQILKKEGNLDLAQMQLEQIVERYPSFEQRAQVVFELAQLDYKNQKWEECYQKCRHFLSEFPTHELSLYAGRYLASSSVELSSQHPEKKEQLLVDLETFLSFSIPEYERGEWIFFLAKTNYELGLYEKAKSYLETLDLPNAQLLLALCYRDGEGNLEMFAHLAETALSAGANLMDLGQLHTALFNAYLELSDWDQAADHLYAAFAAKTPTQPENLLWLADFYYHRLEEEEGNFSLANRTAEILAACPEKQEPTLCQLAKVYAILGRLDDAIALLEKVESPGKETQLLLAESYAKKGVVEKAVQMFDEIVSSSATLRDPFCASAALQGIKLKLTFPQSDVTKIATQLKNLTIQKNFEAEPLYLEAALEYVELQGKSDPSKKLALLQQTKRDFEQTEDLLSKDYHAARAQSPRKNKIYESYMKFIEAEILSLQGKLEPKNGKDLQAKSKDLLLQIINEQPTTALRERAQNKLHESKA